MRACSANIPSPETRLGMVYCWSIKASIATFLLISFKIWNGLLLKFLTQKSWTDREEFNGGGRVTSSFERVLMFLILIQRSVNIKAQTFKTFGSDSNASQKSVGRSLCGRNFLHFRKQESRKLPGNFYLCNSHQ